MSDYDGSEYEYEGSDDDGEVFTVVKVDLSTLVHPLKGPYAVSENGEVPIVIHPNHGCYSVFGSLLAHYNSLREEAGLPIVKDGDKIERWDPLLVKTVMERPSKLKLESIPKDVFDNGAYRIDEYEGAEDIRIDECFEKFRLLQQRISLLEKFVKEHHGDDVLKGIL